MKPAIAEGNTKISEIANFSGIESKKLFPYLEILESVGFTKRLLPVLGRKRNALYLIKDNFMDFWFRFIHKYRSYIEIDNIKVVEKRIFDEINAFIGRKFEDVCEYFIIRKFPFSKIGKQWGKIPKAEKGKNTYEIDIVGVNENTKELLALEVKWKDLGLKDVKEIISELEKKIKFVQWFNDERKEKLGIFAKKINKKAKEWLKEHNYLAFDLKDIEEEAERK